MAFDATDRLRIPSISTPEDLKQRRVRFLKSIARLKPGVALSQAQAEMSTLPAAENSTPTKIPEWESSGPWLPSDRGGHQTACCAACGRAGVLIACDNVPTFC